MYHDYSHILSRIPDLKPMRRPLTWQGRCVVHEDHRPSFTAWIGRKGNLLMRCWGCRAEFAVICAALGVQMRECFPDSNAPPRQQRRIDKLYDYTDEEGRLLYQVVRYIPKDFRQRRPVGQRGEETIWQWDMNGVRKVLYRLPEVQGAILEGRRICITEGEQAADALRRYGITATTNVGGAGKWISEYGEQLDGAHIVILPDNDAPGKAHAAIVAGYCMCSGPVSVCICQLPDLPERGDCVQWLKRMEADGESMDQASVKAALAFHVRKAETWKKGSA